MKEKNNGMKFDPDQRVELKNLLNFATKFC